MYRISCPAGCDDRDPGATPCSRGTAAVQRQLQCHLAWHVGRHAATLSCKRLPDGRWSYGSRSSAQGLFRLALPAELTSRSVFSIRDGKVVPERFTGEDGTDSQRRDQELVFDWERGRVTGIAETKPVDLPLQPGMQDGMSVQVALMQALLTGSTPPAFLLIDKTKVKEYVYTQEGTADLQTALGPRQTVIYRSSPPGCQRGTWFWCAPDWATCR